MNLSKLLNKDDKYLLACSFGPDSMSLFHMLKIAGYHFDVAHVNYGLREEAKSETEKLAKYCEKNNVQMFKLFANVDAKKNIEDECRKIRYSFFSNLSATNKYKAVLVAHNQDDLIETYLMQNKRKIYANYYGIKENVFIFGINVIRPLLNVSKANLEAYCIKNNVPYAIDKTNLENDYLRNRIRHEIVSRMNQIERENILKEINNKNLNQEKILRRLNSIDFDGISGLDFEENALAINLILKRFNSELVLSAKCCDQIKKIILSDKPNVIFKINEKVSFIKEYKKYYFVSNKKEGTYSFDVDSPQVLDNEFVHFNLKDKLNDHNLSADDFPVTIRTFESGDRYQIKNYSVPVRRLFIDWKMPISTRKRWPLIVNRYGIVKFIPRYRADFNIQTTPDFFVKL